MRWPCLDPNALEICCGLLLSWQVFLTAKNSPNFLLRFVHPLAPPVVVLVCDRFFTAPSGVVASRFVDGHPGSARRECK